jgi:hypothetical protein
VAEVGCDKSIAPSVASGYLAFMAPDEVAPLPFFHGPLTARAKSMRANFTEIQRRHKGEQGRRREDDLRDFLMSFFPGRLAVGTGEIVASDGSISPQMDLIVYDALETPLLDRSESSVVVPVEGVYGVVEVSSRLDGRKLREDNEKIRTVKAMTKDAYFDPPWGTPFDRTFNVNGADLAAPFFPVLGFCFSYDSVEIDTLIKRLAELDSDDPRENLDMICSLEKGIIGNAIPDDSEFGGKWRAAPMPETGRLPLRIDPSGIPGGALMLFYVLMASVLMQADTPAIRVAAYIET